MEGADGSLIGTNQNGGPYGGGVVFEVGTVAINPPSLPAATVNLNYSQTLTASVSASSSRPLSA